MSEQQFKRNVAYKLRIGDLLIGKPILDKERFSFLELGDKKIVRVNLVANIVDKYEGENAYYSFTLDDGSGQIRLKVFGDNIGKFKELTQGQTVVVIGVLRFFNNEIYISPEIIKEVDTRYLLIRKLEIEKKLNVKKEITNFAIKDKILELIKNSEEQGGIELEKLIMNSSFNKISPDIINKEIQKLLEEGIIFEPRPGKVRWLG